MTETKDEPIKENYERMWQELITQLLNLKERGVDNIDPVIILDYMSFMYQRAHCESALKQEIQKHESLESS